MFLLKTFKALNDLLCADVPLRNYSLRGLPPTQHMIIGHLRNKSFQAITCTGNDNRKQTGENTPKAQKHNKQALGK